jgi:predicted transposase/invertase (TIGR01784 family)
MCKINPKVGFVFKKLFGSEKNKDLLISLLNSILFEKDRIKTVELLNPYNLEDYKQDKMSILDIIATDEKERKYKILLQIGEDLNFVKRAVFYWSKMVTDKLSERMMFKKLNKTICINILDFNIVSNNSDFHNIYKILNNKAVKNDNLHDVLEFHYIELKKFQKEFCHISNNLDRWLFFFNNADKLNIKNVPQELSQDSEILKAISEIDTMFDEEELKMYNNKLQMKMEFENKLDFGLKKEA